MSALRIGAVRGLGLALTAAALAAQGQPPSPPPAALVTTLQSEADGTRTLHQSIVVAAPLAEVWQAVTTGAGWRGWAAPFAQVDLRLGGFIETSYAADARAGDPANIRNQIVAYAPPRLLAIRNTQAPPRTAFDVATFQTLHTVVLLDPVDARRTRVSFVQPGYRDGEAYDTVLRHFRAGNGWTLEKLQERFDRGPIDWAKMAAEAQERARAAAASKK